MRKPKDIIGIKKAMLDVNVKQIHVARKLGLRSGDINNVIAGRRRSRRISDELIRVGVPKIFFEEYQDRQN